MKKSKRYLRNTLLAISSVVVAYVIFNRLFGVPDTAELPERTAPSELAALRDFTAIHVRGDFELEITGQPQYSIAYFPLDDLRGNFTARTEGSTLVLVGFGNVRDNTPARVNIGLPQLRSLTAFNIAALTLTNLTGSTLDMELSAMGRAPLRDNRIEDLRVNASFVRTLELDAESFAASSIRVQGATTVTPVD